MKLRVVGTRQTFARRGARGLALAALLIAVASLASDSPPTAQLITGARHFREEKYPEALIAFKAAERMGAEPEVRWYIAATLSKLGHIEDAVESFHDAAERAPQSHDALLAYYYAMACYEAQLYACAEAQLKTIGARAGPRVGAQAKKVLGDLVKALASVPAESIDILLARGGKALESDRARLALAYFEEAAALAERREDSERLRRALDRSAQARARQPKGASR